VAKSDPARNVWTKSSASTSSDCVEVALDERGVRVRNSRDPSGAMLVFSPSEWMAFLTGVRGGEFDLRRLGRS
jgi:hypothetical protein